MRGTLNYPHVRFASGGVHIMETPEDFGGGFKYLKGREGWSRSSLDKVEAVNVSDDKCHFNIEFSRYHENGEKYVTHQSLWIVTKKDGRWGIQGRSSFAP